MMHWGAFQMTIEEINNSIEYWSNWASIEENKRYDIALMKIWVQFEKFISDLFVNYSLGIPSENGYLPKRSLEFKSETQLNAFLRPENRTFIDYPSQIQKLSKYIFEKNPFDIIFLDSNNNVTYLNIMAIRNYVAHESGESREKLIKNLFANRADKFEEPSVFLLKKEKNSKITHYSFYVKFIRDTAQLLTEELSD